MLLIHSKLIQTSQKSGNKGKTSALSDEKTQGLVYKDHNEDEEMNLNNREGDESEEGDEDEELEEDEEIKEIDIRVKKRQRKDEDEYGDEDGDESMQQDDQVEDSDLNLGEEDEEALGESEGDY